MSHVKRHIVLAVTLAEHGGVQEFLLRFASFLRSQGHEVTLVAGEGAWLLDKAAAQGISTHKLIHLRRDIHPWHDALAFFELYCVLRELRPHAIHLNSTKMGILGSFAARLIRVPKIVYRIGGWVFLEPLSTVTRWLYRSLEKLSARWKDVIICVHPGDAEVARQFGIQPLQDLRVIPNGIDLGNFDAHLLSREMARQRLSIEPETFVIGTLANLFPAKGLSGYLDACAMVHTAFPTVKFFIIGDGPERVHLEKKRSALGLTTCVIFTGRREGASHLLRAFDAFVLPSAKEGMSWALLEAMAASLPCLATEVGANVWLIAPEAGWLVPPQDPNFLAQRMKELLVRKEEGERRGRLARTRIERDFPLETTLQQNEKALID